MGNKRATHGSARPSCVNLAGFRGLNVKTGCRVALCRLKQTRHPSPRPWGLLRHWHQKEQKWRARPRLCINCSVPSHLGFQTGFQTLYLVMVLCYLQVTAMISNKNRSKNNKNPSLLQCLPSFTLQPLHYQSSRDKQLLRYEKQPALPEYYQ